MQVGGAYTTFSQDEGILPQKNRNRYGRCIATLFKNNGSGVNLSLLISIAIPGNPFIYLCHTCTRVSLTFSQLDLGACMLKSRYSETLAMLILLTSVSISPWFLSLSGCLLRGMLPRAHNTLQEGESHCGNLTRPVASYHMTPMQQACGTKSPYPIHECHLIIQDAPISA